MGMMNETVTGTAVDCEGAECGTCEGCQISAKQAAAEQAAEDALEAADEALCGARSKANAAAEKVGETLYDIDGSKDLRRKLERARKLMAKLEEQAAALEAAEKTFKAAERAVYGD